MTTPSPAQTPHVHDDVAPLDDVPTAVPDDHDVRATFRAARVRFTTPRRKVFEVLRDEAAHLTAEEIADHLASDAQPVSLASVYRALPVLEDVGLARMSRLGEGPATWELDHADEAFHLVCDGCGDVQHHRGELVRTVSEHLHADHAFHATSVQLVVHGRCASCAIDDEQHR